MARKYQGHCAAASRAYAAARRILLLRPDSDRLAALYHNLGGLEHARGRLARAEVLARRGLALRIRTCGDRHPDVARDLAALGAILDARGLQGEAEAAYRQALAIFRRGWLRLQRDIAAALGNLAVCLHRAGRPREAEEAGRQAVRLSARWLGHSHPETLIATENLEVILEAKSRREQLGVAEDGKTYGDAQVGPPKVR
jgi:tetratricopeptide (TPR) repeat protein